MPKARLTTETVIQRRAQLLDEGTPDALSLGLRRGIMIRAKSRVCPRRSDDDAVDATHFLRSVLHGFVALETSGAFELPVDPKRSYESVVESVVTALATWRRS